MPAHEHTVFIRYRRTDGRLFEEGGGWLPLSAPAPSFEHTGMRIHEALQRDKEAAEDFGLVAVDRMVWICR